MNLFTAAVYSNNYMPGQNRYVKLFDNERRLVEQMPHILESYHYVGKQQYVDAMRENGARVFIDSGAFSAYTLGINIDLPTYCDYIKRNLDIIRVEDGIVMASVLDGIGDPLATYRNQLAMESLGVRPLPCFHAGEDERYLDWYVANYEYITLGGMVGASTKQLCIWLDRIWSNNLTDGSGNAKLKVHGFGITSPEIMARYPWYSCDSSSWIQAAAFGSIFTTQWGPIPISDKSPSRHDRGQHVSTLSKIEQQMFFKHLEDNGFSYERLSTIYESRAAYNLWAYKMLGDKMNEKQKPVNFVQELF